MSMSWALQISAKPDFYDKTIVGFYMNRIEQIYKMPKASKNQQDKILEEIRKNRAAFYNSDAGQSLLNDIRIEKVNKQY